MYGHTPNIFEALADSTRRTILETLAMHGQLSATDISNQFHTSAPAISQHLKVLREAKLVDVEKQAQKRIYTINTHTIHDLETWAHRMTKEWDKRFDRLDKVLEREKLHFAKASRSR